MSPVCAVYSTLNLREAMKTMRSWDKCPGMERLQVMKGKYARLLETCDVGEFVQQYEATMAPDSLPLCEAGQCLADLTTIQAIFRDLDVGETRKDLVRKVTAGLARHNFPVSRSTPTRVLAPSRLSRFVSG